MMKETMMSFQKVAVDSRPSSQENVNIMVKVNKLQLQVKF